MSYSNSNSPAPPVMPQNYTIDDSQWSTPSLSLSAGWNMLRTNGSNEYINATQVSIMQPLLSEFWNNSISWTTTPGSETTLTFVGTDIWAFGISSSSSGSFNVTLDNTTLGTYTSYDSQSTDYHHVLFSAHNLQDGLGHEHHLTFTNTDGDGGSLAFDYAVIQSTDYFDQTNLTATTASAASASASAALASASALAESAAAAEASASEAAAEALSPYSASQLAALETVYKFHWNGAAYFTVIFSVLLIVIFLVFIVHNLFVSIVNRQRKSSTKLRNASPTGTGESWLMSPNPSTPSSSKKGKERERPRTRVMEALRGKNISNPIPSDAGSLSTRRDSDATINQAQSDNGHEHDHGNERGYARGRDEEQGW